MSNGLRRLGLPENAIQGTKFADHFPFMTWFTTPPAMPMQFSITCLGPRCKKKRGDPGVHGRVRCVPKIMSGGPQQREDKESCPIMNLYFSSCSLPRDAATHLTRPPSNVYLEALPHAWPWDSVAASLSPGSCTHH